MFGRTIRDKISSIYNLVSENNDEEAKGSDIINKYKGKKDQHAEGESFSR